MTRTELVEFLISKAFKDNPVPFQRTKDARSQDVFSWSGVTRVRRKKDDSRFEVTVTISVVTNPKLRDQVAACLCRDDGVKFRDLRTIMFVDPRISGDIEVTGIPGKNEKQPFTKFMAQYEKEVAEQKAAKATEPTE